MVGSSGKQPPSLGAFQNLININSGMVDVDLCHEYQDTFIPLISGNPKSFRSSVPGTAVEDQIHTDFFYKSLHTSQDRCEEIALHPSSLTLPNSPLHPPNERFSQVLFENKGWVERGQ